MKRRASRGVSLIEVLIGIVIVTIASIATLQYFAYAKSGIGRQGHRREALERARQRLEETLSVGIVSIQPPDNTLYWLTCNGGACQRSTNDPHETIPVDGVNRPMATTIQCQHDPAAGTPASACDTLAIDVRVWFTANTGTDDNFNRVYVRTLRTS